MGRHGCSLLLATCVGLLIATPAQSQLWATDGICMADAGLSPNATSAIADGSGGVYVTWANWGAVDFDVFLQHYDANGARVSGWPVDGLIVADAANAQSGPAIALDQSGGVYVAWDDYRTNNADPDVYLTHVAANGTFATGWAKNGRAVDTEPSSWGQSPKLVSDGAGGVVVAYESWYANLSYLGVKAIRYDSNGFVNANWDAYGHWVSSYYFSMSPNLVADGLGSYVVTFEADNGTATKTYAKRFNRNGALDANWSYAPYYKGVEVGSPVSGDKRNCQLAQAAAGFVAFAYTSDWRGGGDTDIMACQYDSTGAFSSTGAWWMSIDVSTVVGDCDVPRMVADGSGGVVLAWRDMRNVGTLGYTTLYAQRLDVNGTRTGSGVTTNAVARHCTGGVQLVRLSDGTYRASFTSDYAGGADVYAQQFSSAFSVPSGWNAFYGNSICSAANAQLCRGMVNSGATDAIVVWDDQRPNATPGIYGAKIQSTGAVPALSSLRLIESEAGRVTVEWTIEGEHAVSVERSVDGVAWDAAGDAVEFATGQFRFVDEQAPAGAHVAYRPVFASGGHGEAAWVQVSAREALALRFAQGNPARGTVLFECTLPSGAPARLRVHDVSGRLVESRTLAAGGARTVAWSRGDRPAGLYLVTLEQGGVTRRAKLSLLD
ncbi:MAG: T9SS type A sorting domain-containing protein [Candidatus Eisenbacteria bacterium]|uniref:T9SS type A sorting domain-containing protein n=1 Tax=Eiseniibacteriota bacterium TaxID=2212470 RepID=A0A933W3P3_UNCEI|nr:T9SS type A sorting domain-containing protein [Candidatus Eisenbacteria bacterium]